jgi:alpha-L-rhamnosidase
MKIGKSYLDPAWTDYSKRVYYSEYNITNDIVIGKNCLGVTLGNGFFNPLPMKMWGKCNIRDYLPTERPIFIAKLKLTYENGNTKVICTDNTWKYNYGPVQKNSVYLGELYDARKGVNDWNIFSFDDSKWLNVQQKKGPGGALQKVFFPVIEEYEVIKPVKISSTHKGVYVIDMGVNFSGTFRIRLYGKSGDTVKIRTGERIYETGEINPMTVVCGQIKRKGAGGPGSPEVAWPIDTYIFGNNEDIWYSPQLTSHIYRYMEITGMSEKPNLADIEGIAFSSKVQNFNKFSCSSDLLNSIQTASVRTFLDNLIGVQSDCAGRERFGYGGDLNSTGETFINNFDMHTFYRKTIYDWVDAINDSVFIDTAPYVGLKYCGISWESAFLTTQYYLYLYYNDTDIIRQLYELDLWWMEKVAKIHPSALVDKGLADHEALKPSPVELIGTSHYLQCARIMKKFAAIMNDQPNVEKFVRLEARLTDNILNLFWRKQYTKPINKQTLFASLLYYDLLPQKERIAATDSLLKAVNSGFAGHFTTGIFGTKYILEALSATGNVEKVYDIVNSRIYPGWGFMIDRGATTIWETWKESDNTFSNCHPMFGTVSEWYYRWLGGIRPNPEFPGFRKFTIAPSIPKGLNYVRCTYHSPFGKIVSDWDKKGENSYVFIISIPKVSEALVHLPFEKQVKIAVREKDNNGFMLTDKTGSSFELKAGDYSIETGILN